MKLVFLLYLLTSSAPLAAATVTQTVLVQFRPNLHHQRIQDASKSFLALKDKCTYKGTNDKYILSLTGGKDNSLGWKQREFTHGFVATFENVTYRNFYMKEDQHRATFFKYFMELVHEDIVLDYKNGTF